jgi:hypothetical protein
MKRNYKILLGILVILIAVRLVLPYVELGDVRKDTTGFRQLLKKFMPLKVNRFEVGNGTIRYIDNGSKPKVDECILSHY